MMANQIDRDVFVKYDALKNPIEYTRGANAIPIVLHFRDISIPDGATARAIAMKPSGKAVYNSAVISGNDVTVNVDQQMFVELGVTELQVNIVQGNYNLVTFSQPVIVKPNYTEGDIPPSENDSDFLNTMITEAQEAVDNANQAVLQANKAIEDANDAIAGVNAVIGNMDDSFSSLAQTTPISQLQTTSKYIVGAINELNSKTILPERYIDYTGSDIDSALVSAMQALPVRSWQHITFRTIDASNTGHVLNNGVWEVDVWRYATNYGTLTARTYNLYKSYQCNWQNGVLQGWVRTNIYDVGVIDCRNYAYDSAECNQALQDMYDTVPDVNRFCGILWAKVSSTGSGVYWNINGLKSSENYGFIEIKSYTSNMTSHTYLLSNGAWQWVPSLEGTLETSGVIEPNTNLDDYFPADGYPCGYYRVNGLVIGGTTVYGAMLLLGDPSTKSCTVQILFSSTRMIIRAYVGNPNSWQEWIMFSGSAAS